MPLPTPAPSEPRRFFGKYRGRVADNVDPQRLARLSVTVPALLGEATVWAMPCTPYAGDGVGFFALPPVDAGVWVEFEAGELDHPIWSGCFWGDGQVPAASAGPDEKVLKTAKVTIRVDDAAGEILIETEGGASLRLTALELAAKATRVTQQTDGAAAVLDAARFDVNNGALSVV